MSPTPTVSTRTTSERRAAAARANGAKSRGPVTAQGKANSSRNSRKSGLRSTTLFPDHRSDESWIALLAAHTAEVQPQSDTERLLVETLATTVWRQRFIWALEKTIVSREIRNVQSLHPDESPSTTLALAYGSLADNSCSLDRLLQVERALFNQFDCVLDRLNTVLARRGNPLRNSLATFSRNFFLNERTQQLAENTTPRSGGTQ
jgi:hypothetical protein